MTTPEYKDYGKEGLKKNGSVRKGFWRMKDRRVIKISEMEDSHLRNSMRMLERMANAKHQLENVRPFLTMPWPDEDTMAFVAVEAEFTAALERVPDQMLKWYELLEEANLRGLEV